MNKNKVFYLISLLTFFTIISLFLLNCSGRKNLIPASSSALLWSSQSPSPDWIYKEPYSDNGNYIFVGLSGKHTTERDARDDALRHSRIQFVNYIGTDIKHRYERIETSYNLSSGITDATVSELDFIEMFSEGVARGMRSSQWYIERRKSQTGNEYYLVYTLSTIPKAEVDKEFLRLEEEIFSNLYSEIFEVNIIFENIDGTQLLDPQNHIGQLLTQRNIKITNQSKGYGLTENDVKNITNGNIDSLSKIKLNVRAKYIITGYVQAYYSGPYHSASTGIQVCRARGEIKIIDIYTGTVKHTIAVDGNYTRGFNPDKTVAGRQSLVNSGKYAGEQLAKYIELSRLR